MRAKEFAITTNRDGSLTMSREMAMALELERKNDGRECLAGGGAFPHRRGGHLGDVHGATRARSRISSRHHVRALIG